MDLETVELVGIKLAELAPAEKPELVAFVASFGADVSQEVLDAAWGSFKPAPEKDAKQIAADAKAAAAQVSKDASTNAFKQAKEAGRQARLTALANERTSRDEVSNADAEERDRIEKAALEAVKGLAVLRNNHRSPLQLGKVTLAPNAESPVSHEVMASKLVKNWIKAKILTVVKKAK